MDAIMIILVAVQAVGSAAAVVGLQLHRRFG